jgi:hypothetical protein
LPIQHAAYLIRKKESLMATTPSPNSFRYPILNWLTLAGSMSLMLGLWHRNYNLLGSFYDYSILTSANGYLHDGLRPYRDFTTPLQSLPIYLSYFFELLFGPRYVSLGYGNLIVGMTAYGCLLPFLRRAVGFHLAVLSATAICVCTFFQHGILWYNSLAMFFTSLICLLACGWLRQPKIPRLQVSYVFVLALLSSMTKFNFHALAMGITIMVLVTALVTRRHSLKTVIGIASGLLIFGLCLGPLVEVVINRTSLSVYVENVFRTPTGRGTELFNFLNPNLYFGKISDFYPDNFSAGIYLMGWLVYAGCLYFAVLRAHPPGDAMAEGGSRSFKCKAAFFLSFFFVASLLLTVTNMDTQTLTSCFLIVGLISGLIILAPQLGSQQSLTFKFGIFILSAFLCLAGSASAFMHSRIRYGEPSWSGAMVWAMKTQKHLSALKTAVPFYEAATIDPQFEPYFRSVQFTEYARGGLEKISAFMATTHSGTNAQDIYWGPGLEIMNRVYNNHLKGRLPLWYHLKVTVRDQDAPRIIEEFKRAKYEWFVTTSYMGNLPDEIKRFLDSDYERTEKDEIIVYRAKHPELPPG